MSSTVSTLFTECNGFLYESHNGVSVVTDFSFNDSEQSDLLVEIFK